MLGYRRDLRLLDHIDMPTVRARWQILADDVGRTFSWINYFPTADAASLQPEAFRIDSCEVFGDNGWVVGPDGWFVCCSWRAGQSYLPSDLRVRPPNYKRKYQRVIKLPGTTLSALNDNPYAYGHLLIDGLYKLLKGIQLIGGVERCDQILVPEAMARLLRRSVFDDVALRSKLLLADPGAIYRADSVLAVTHPACCMNVSQAQLDLLRTARPADRTGPARRIFLVRPPGNRRGITNLDEVRRVFAGHGYMIATGDDLDDSWAAFANADVVAGVHGSDLADCIFMRGGSTLLEIIPSDHRKPYYFNVAARLGIDFRCLLAESATRRPTVHGPSSADIRVDGAALDVVLNAIDGGAPSSNSCSEASAAPTGGGVGPVPE